MGTVITFPDARRRALAGAGAGEHGEPATVIILPVVRIEREGEAPSGTTEPGATPRGRARRRRARA
jgi:hypothetical protein